MTGKRHTRPELGPTDKPMWIEVRTMWQRQIECEKLPPGTDLKAVLVRYMAKYSTAGWTLESFASNHDSVYVNRGKDRYYISIRPTDPSKPTPSMHGPSSR
jgi:hypothetical protein